ncbi:hypothetical protein T06_13478 [Trichinella sp. T6]|nr:hypothetical protein T06_5494 [Trichinella sp. T6]KRX75650.1 hypothetical protein T06_13492 [Trichinella sp. T6]KRX78613.1 hypothetical protein T06_13478 [Trichinella sp. T6]
MLLMKRQRSVIYYLVIFSASFPKIPRKCWTKNAIINHEHLDILTVLPTSAFTFFTTNGPTARRSFLLANDHVRFKL